MFEDIKNKIIDIVKDSNTVEVNNNTNNSGIGIYMIYVENFDDEKIIPIYIGQTGFGDNRNFQSRYKEHLKEIMALNRLQYNYYKELLLEGFYEGYYKTCKIFQYMINHNCTLKDFHMIVLEYVDYNNEKIQDLLDLKEQEYFDKYMPAYFGFNQLNTVVEISKGLLTPERLLKFVLNDCENLIKYWGYGYTKFNYYHCFPKEYSSSDNNPINNELNDKIAFLKKSHFDVQRFKECKNILPKLEQCLKDNNNKYDMNQREFEEKFAPIIKEYCLDNKIGIKQKYKELISLVINQSEYSINMFFQYLKRKRINDSILDILNNNKDFVDWRIEHDNLVFEKNRLQKEINNCRRAEFVDDLIRLLPSKEYDCYPLRDNYSSIDFKEPRENELILNLEFSNHGIPNYWYYYEFSLIKIDYIVKKNNKIIERKDIFIRSRVNDTISNYFEKDHGEQFKINITPFCVRRFPDYISTAMEYQNGINDYTLINKSKNEIEDVFDELNDIINEETTVVVNVRNKMKSRSKEYIKTNYNRDNVLKQKIIEFLSKRGR